MKKLMAFILCATSLFYQISFSMSRGQRFAGFGSRSTRSSLESSTKTLSPKASFTTSTHSPFASSVRKQSFQDITLHATPVNRARQALSTATTPIRARTPQFFGAQTRTLGTTQTTNFPQQSTRLATPTTANKFPTSSVLGKTSALSKPRTIAKPKKITQPILSSSMRRTQSSSAITPANAPYRWNKKKRLERQDISAGINALNAQRQGYIYQHKYYSEFPYNYINNLFTDGGYPYDYPTLLPYPIFAPVPSSVVPDYPYPVGDATFIQRPETLGISGFSGPSLPGYENTASSDDLAASLAVPESEEIYAPEGEPEAQIRTFDITPTAAPIKQPSIRAARDKVLDAFIEQALKDVNENLYS